MKKILSIVLLLSAMVSYAADYSVVIPATSVRAGHSAEMSIEINNTNDLMAYQFYLDVPAGITITGGSVAGTRTETLGGATTNFDAAGTNPYVVQVYGNDKAAPITGTSGVVCKLTIEADASTAPGDYTITVRNIQLSALVGGTTTTITGTAVDGGDYTISVTENKLDLYDDAAAAPATSTETENVVLHRNFTAGVWNSFCVPFDMSAAQIEEAFGSGAQVAEFTSWTADDKDEAAEITLSFTSTATITANTPYIVMPTADATYATGVSISGVNGIEADEVANEIKVKFGTKNRTFGFYGVYVPTVMKTVGDFPLYLKDNKFYYATDNTKIKGYRAFFNNDDTIISSLFEVKYCIDEDPTAIELVDEDVENGMAYTIDGKFVGKNVNLKRMQKGVYIVNGKKVINK